MIDDLVALLEGPAADDRYDEVVTQREHALQCARLAEETGADDELIAAALLHDVGHLSQGQSSLTTDLRHEAAGARLLAGVFGPRVATVVGLHVIAKRYLCAVEPGYRAGLSAASEHSLLLQGGPLTAEEVAAFEIRPHHCDAIELRRWDDQAKVPGAQTPPVDHYAPVLRRVAAQAGAGAK